MIARFNPIVWAKGLMLAVALLAVLFAGLLLSRVVWQVASGPNSISVPPISQTQANNNGQLARLATDIADRSILGVVPVQRPEPVPEPSPEPRPEPPPVSPLTFDLVGVMASSDPESGSAIISRSQGAPGENFKVGDNVYGQAVLVEVHNRFVVFERNGQREQLEFDPRRAGGTAGLAPSITDIAGSGMASVGMYNQPTPEGELSSSRSGGMRGTPTASTPGSGRGPSGTAGSPLAGNSGSSSSESSETTSTGSGGNADPMREFAENLIEQARRNPQSLLSGYGISATSEGYRIGNNARLIIMTTDLRAGDLITEINGMRVGNVEQDQARLDEFMAGGTFGITVQRDNDILQMSVRIPSLF